MSLSRIWLMVPFLLFACTNDDSSTPGTSSAGSSSTGGSSTGGSASAQTSGNAGSGATAGTSSSGGSTAVVDQPACADPVDLGVRFVGRYDACTTEGVRIQWSGTGFVGTFTGTGVSVRLREGSQANEYTVLIDGVVGSTLITTSGEGTYTLGENLASGEHQVELYRRTEASFGITTILSVDVTGGSLAAAPAAPERSIEIIGDSISCGYGNEGATASCTFSAATENHYLSYGPLLARQFDAEASTVAWSGRGVIWNYGASTSDPRMPALYERAIPGDTTSVWDFSVKPQAVIVNLGTNDYSSTANPNPTDFTTAYEALLIAIRSHYPDAFILCTNGPMLYGDDLTAVRARIVEAVELRMAAGDSMVEAHELQATNPSPGCDYHPSLATHQTIADELAAELSDKLGW